MTRTSNLCHYLLLATVASLSLYARPASAAEFSVRVIDQHGDPVRDAVIEIPGNPVQQAPADVAIIDQVNKRFVPMVIAVQQGQSVNFPNSDNFRHHVYSFSPIRQFSTELYADIPGAPIVFDKPGVAVLGCNIHDSMVGYIFVSAWQDVAVTDASGTVSFSRSSIPLALKVWHPWSADPDNQREISTASFGDSKALEIKLTLNRPDQVFGFRALSHP